MAETRLMGCQHLSGGGQSYLEVRQYSPEVATSQPTNRCRCASRAASRSATNLRSSGFIKILLEVVARSGKRLSLSKLVHKPLLEARNLGPARCKAPQCDDCAVQ
jgi:hypothetical protein